MAADRVVFDAEPLVAHAAGEAGSRAVASYLEAVATQATAGFVGSVTLAEVRYTLARKYDRGTADEYLEWLEAIGIESVEADAVWRAASGYVLDYSPALGDAFALAAAEHREAGDVADVRVVDEEHRAQFGVAESFECPLLALPPEPPDVDSLLPVDGHRAPGTLHEIALVHGRTVVEARLLS